MKRFSPILFLVGICWLVFGLNAFVLGGALTRHGIIPRHVAGLPGIVWSPFIHGSLQHLVANTLPLLILGGIVCAREREDFALVTILGILASGALTWMFARPASHIGASGLVFCYFGYLTSLAWFNRTFGTLALSILCLIAYGGMVRGVLPTNGPISWEGHAAGLLTGVALAWFLTRVKKA